MDLHRSRKWRSGGVEEWMSNEGEAKKDREEEEGRNSGRTEWRRRGREREKKKTYACILKLFCASPPLFHETFLQFTRVFRVLGGE